MYKIPLKNKWFSVLVIGFFVMGLWLALDALPANASCYCVALKSKVGMQTGKKIGARVDGCSETDCLTQTSCGLVCNMTAVSQGECEFVVTARSCAAVAKDLGCCECNDGSKDTNIGSDKTCGMVCASKKGKKSWNEGACKTVASSGNSAGPPPKKYYNLYNAVGTVSIPELIGRFINVFLGIVGAIALAVFVYGGVMWMTARGNAKQADSARGAIVNAVIGLAIIAFAYTLSSNFITMLTTVQVPPPEKLPAEQQTTAETEQAAEQQSVQQQKAAEQQAKEAGSQSAPAVSCAPGRTCVDLTCEDKTIYSQCWAAGCSGIQVCCPTTLTCPSP